MMCNKGDERKEPRLQRSSQRSPLSLLLSLAICASSRDRWERKGKEEKEKMRKKEIKKKKEKKKKKKKERKKKKEKKKKKNKKK